MSETVCRTNYHRPVIADLECIATRDLRRAYNFFAFISISSASKDSCRLIPIKRDPDRHRSIVR